MAFAGANGDLVPITNRLFAHSDAIMGAMVNSC